MNDSGVVGDHDQDSLYDLTIGNVEIINCKEKERKPSKIDIPFVVSIGKINLTLLLKVKLFRSIVLVFLVLFLIHIVTFH